MTTDEKIARRKFSLLELAADLRNVSKTCKVIGYSRQQFYEIRRNYQTYGAAGLLDKLPGAKGPHPNRVPEESEKAILDYSLQFPTMARYAFPRSSRCAISRSAPAAFVASGATMTYSRNTIGYCVLEKTQQESAITLSDDQIHLLEHFSPEFRERQIDVQYSGELVAVDTFLRRLPQGHRPCICRPLWIASADTPGPGYTPANCL